jgi:predicted PurR-regulated permease PerM
VEQKIGGVDAISSSSFSVHTWLKKTVSWFPSWFYPVVTFLLLLNTILLSFVVINSKTQSLQSVTTKQDMLDILDQFEATKVWWKENYSLVQKIYSTDAFKVQQKQLIEDMLNKLMGATPSPLPSKGE